MSSAKSMECSREDGSVEYSRKKNNRSSCRVPGSPIFVTSVENSRKKNMMVGYPEASVPLSVRIESCKQAFIGCCSSFDIIARTEYSLILSLSIFNLLNAH